ncbi:hypothetical protein HG536_0C05970 [Torulaspora globosa]|uniref:Zn(2)-C6 fungal-type domain-containing protein n=1 Tax=Torulaspora globosa TaxID=48254 RepID=A0A7G3ZFZ2_9SACH|nr:uncharacterized protein HG536_0C05970 [Torulaspora globosa]QLL32428.1 hypothetical protein HG536_0C05970 [Torulaspora globosa]
MGNYESKKRTRPCLSCKRQKLKCQYDKSLPCERCTKHGLDCYFPPNPKEKVYTNDQPNVESTHLQGHVQPKPKPLTDVPNMINSMIRPYIHQTEQSTAPAVGIPSSSLPAEEKPWLYSVEQRLDVLQKALESVLGIFQHNQVQHEQQVNLLQAQVRRHAHANTGSPSSGPVAEVSLPSLSQIIGESGNLEQVTDFRKNKILSSDEAAQLLEIFCTKMSAHMFGYNLKELTVQKLWNESPLLLVAICTVACPHHQALCSKKALLQKSLQWFSSRLVNGSDILDDEVCVERAILGLVIASLWLESNQLYMSIAVQLARKWRLDQRIGGGEKGELWKLWYLLYIADGSLNLTMRKSPSIYKQVEPAITSVRETLLAHVEDQNLKDVLRENEIIDEGLTKEQLLSLNEVDHSKIKVSFHALQNMHLCALVEYHAAIESLFHNTNHGSVRAMSSLLKPHAFGIPWETNMDLDRWMISWTIALQSIDVQNDAWCLKSTLLYYNFARMHINTRWLLDREVSLEDSSWMQVWRNASQLPERSTLDTASHEVSYSAAYSLLKLATKDKDMRSLFQFFPNHIYLILLYACMIVLEPPNSLDCTDAAVIKKLKQSFKLAQTYRDMLISHTATDSVLTGKIADSIKTLMINFINVCAERRKKSSSRDQKIEEIIQDSSDPSLPGRTKKTISAWPSVNHGHP